MQFGQEPEITKRDPQAYYYYLQQMGMSPYQAAQQVQSRFGPGKTAEQRAKEQASSQQNAALAQTAGVVGGALVAREAAQGFPNIVGTTPNYPSSGSYSITRPVPSETLNLDAMPSQATSSAVATPKVLEVKGDVATVQLPNGNTDTIPTEALNNQSFMSDINWAKVGQGALGATQLYQAYQAAQSGDYAGTGIYGTAGAANVAASGAIGTAAQTGASQALGGYLVPGANILVGAYGGYKTAEALGDMAAGSQRTKTGIMGGATSGAAIGAGIGSIVPGAGTGIGAAIGAVVGGLAGAVGSWTGSKKGKAQFMRDQIRGVLQQGGVLSEDYKGTLADGSTYDFGKDGSTLKWKNIDKIAEANPNSWSSVVPLTDALATAYGFVGQKASDISAWYAKGAVSNANDDPAVAIANARHFAAQQGITFDGIKQKLDEAMADNRLSQSQYDHYLNGARQLTAGLPTTQQQNNRQNIQPKGPAPLPPQDQQRQQQIEKYKQFRI